MEKDIYSKHVLLVKAISDETRLKIVDMLSCGTMCACEILNCVGISQSTLSYHLKLLTDCGLVKVTREGSWMRYSLNKAMADDLLAFLSRLTTEKEECICKTASGSKKGIHEEDLLPRVLNK